MIDESLADTVATQTVMMIPIASNKDKIFFVFFLLNIILHASFSDYYHIYFNACQHYFIFCRERTFPVAEKSGRDKRNVRVGIQMTFGRTFDRTAQSTQAYKCKVFLVKNRCQKNDKEPVNRAFLAIL